MIGFIVWLRIIVLRRPLQLAEQFVLLGFSVLRCMFFFYIFCFRDSVIVWLCFSSVNKYKSIVKFCPRWTPAFYGWVGGFTTFLHKSQENIYHRPIRYILYIYIYTHKTLYNRNYVRNDIAWSALQKADMFHSIDRPTLLLWPFWQLDLYRFWTTPLIRRRGRE